MTHRTYEEWAAEALWSRDRSRIRRARPPRREPLLEREVIVAFVAAGVVLGTASVALRLGVVP